MSLTVSPERILAESASPLVAAPSSWLRRPLGDVASIQNGFAFKSNLFVADSGKPLIRIRDLFNDRTSVGYTGDYDARYIVRTEDLLIGMDGDFNCARWRGPEALLNQRVCKITPDPSVIDIDYLTYVLPGYLEAIHDYTSSTTVTHLSSRDIAKIPLPVPPLDEQRALVEALKSLEAKQESSSKHTERARAAVERFRQAVLAAACSGRLTADWRETSGHSVSPDLITSLNLPEVDFPDLPPSWVRAKVGDIGQTQLGGTPSRKVATYWAGGVPWVSSGEVANCRINTTHETISEDGLAKSSAKLYPRGTVLIAMIGEGKTRGQAAILDIEASTNQNVAGIIPDRRFADPEYLWRWALAEYEITRAVGRGGNQPALNKQKVRELLVPIPPLVEQEEIVLRVDRLLALADNLNRRIDAAGRRIAKTSQAILAKAFRGELQVGHAR